jgi:IS30 family transposase
MANKKKHLSKNERFCIEKMLRVGDSFSKIARTLGRGLSTISEEVNTNGGRLKYNAEKAHTKAYLKQYRKKRDCNAVALNGHIQRFVERKLEKGWSPEAISSRLKKQSGIGYASPKSIRKFINSRSGLERFLFWNRNDHKSGPKKNEIFLKDPMRVFIEERPWYTMFEYGHWELDFIVSKFNQTVLLVAVERLTKVKKFMLLPNRINDLVNKAVVDLLRGHKVKSLTLDNDIAFTKWRDLEVMIEAKIYFCHPYHSWEKGLVENTNRWVRQFIPRKTDLSKYSKEYVQNIEDWFNHMPSETLNGWTPYEKMIEKEFGILVESLEINMPNLRIEG